MRLIIFSTEFPPGPGGIGTHAWQLAKNMVRFGWQVRVLTLQDYAAAPEILDFNRQQPFQVHTLSHKPKAVQEGLHRWFSLARLVRAWYPDVLVATGEQSILITALAFSNIPMVAIWHGVIPPNRWRRSLYRWAYQRMENIIAVSQYSFSKMLEMGIQPRQPWVVTNGADEAHFRPVPIEQVQEFRASIGLSDAQLLLTVGNVSERKGQDIVIQALPEILVRHPDVHYLIAGLPTRQAELSKQAEALGVAQHVHFLGRVELVRLNILYNVCDVFVLTSRHSSDGEFEGYGIVVVEAALCAKPAVVTNNSGLVEAVQDGVTGLVVPENDSHATALAVLHLLEDKSVCQKMGQAARERALIEQTWAACMRHYHALLTEVAHSG